MPTGDCWHQLAMHLKILWSHAGQTLVHQNCCVKRDPLLNEPAASEDRVKQASYALIFWLLWQDERCCWHLQVDYYSCPVDCQQKHARGSLWHQTSVICLIALSRLKWKKQDRLSAAIFCTVFEIKRDIGRKRQIFHTPCISLAWSPRTPSNFCPKLWFKLSKSLSY